MFRWKKLVAFEKKVSMRENEANTAFERGAH